MALEQNKDNLLLEIFNRLNIHGNEGLRQILELIFNKVMKLERNHALGAGDYERNSDRKGYANGYKSKRLNTRLGALDLQVPKTRGIAFYPNCIERGSRSERALKLAVAEMYLKGVSTRRVEKITEQLCGLEIHSTQVSAMAKE